MLHRHTNPDTGGPVLPTLAATIQLLRAGVHMIEYVWNTAEIREPEVFLSAAPLKIPGGDGAPARVYCVEGM